MSNKTMTQDGFTLVEVIASIAIISILLLGVGQWLNFTNKTAISNNVKLVTTHLAKASIERLKIQPDDFFTKEQMNGAPITYKNCQTNQCDKLYRLLINDETYELTVIVKQNDSEEKLNLINILVTVEQPKRHIKSSAEGYVIDET